MSAWYRHALTVFVLLCAVPVTAPAQVTTGKSPAGLFYEVSGSGEPIVILGEQDLAHIKDVAGLLVKGIAGARLVTIPRAGHIANLDAPEAFNQVLDSFLAGH